SARRFEPPRQGKETPESPHASELTHHPRPHRRPSSSQSPACSWSSHMAPDPSPPPSHLSCLAASESPASHPCLRPSTQSPAPSHTGPTPRPPGCPPDCCGSRHPAGNCCTSPPSPAKYPPARR